MLDCALLHDRSVPVGAFHSDVNIIHTRFIDDKLPIDEAYRIILNALRGKACKIGLVGIQLILEAIKDQIMVIQIVSFSNRLYNALELALVQLNGQSIHPVQSISRIPPTFLTFADDKIAASLVLMSQIPHPRASLLSSLDYVQILEATIWFDMQSSEHRPSTYYSVSMPSFARNGRANLKAVFDRSCSLGPEFGKAAMLQILREALLTLELVGLKFVMEASKILALEPATMRDILRYASARSAPSMSHNNNHHNEDLVTMYCKLRDFTDLCSSIASPAPVTTCALSTLKRWAETDSRSHDSEVAGAPIFWDFSGSEPGRARQSERVLIVGLGVMGLGIALSLRRSFDVRGCDISPERLAEAKSHSLLTTSDISSCLAETDCILFVVEKFEQIMHIINQVSAVLASRTDPLTIMVHSTMSASSAAALKDRISSLNKNIQFLEAPISGGPARANRGELLVIAAGDRTVVDAKLPVFEHMAARLYYAGDVGNASKMKALHQIAAAINHVSSFEVVCAGSKCGFSGKLLYDVLVTFAYNQYLADRLPKLLFRDYSPDAQLSIWLKDLMITQDQLEAGRIDTSLVDTVMLLFEMASKKGSLTDSDICVVKCWPGWESMLVSES